VADFSSGTQVRFLFHMALLFCLCSNQALSQYGNLPFRHITPDDGLSQGVVTSILKDSQGFVWMTTYDGINRFDGVEVLSNDKIAPGLGIISTTATIVEDSKGNIWFGSTEALIKFDYEQNRFFTYSLHDKSTQDGKIPKDAFYPYAERKGMIFCSTVSFPRCYIFDSSKETFIPFFFSPTRDSIQPMPIPKEAMYFAEVLCFPWSDEEKGSAISWMEQQSDHTWRWATGYLPGVEGVSHSIRRNDHIDILCSPPSGMSGNEKKGQSQLCIYDIPKRSIISTYQTDYQVSWFERKGGLLFLSSQESGIHIVDEKSGIEIGHIVHEPDTPDGLMSNYSSVFTIAGNALWVSSWGEGVDYAYLGGTLFTSHFSAKEAERHHTSNFVRGIVEDERGHFWCNVIVNGIIELDENLAYIRTLPGTQGMNSSSIFIDDQQVLYFGEKGMWAYDIRHEKLGMIPVGKDGRDQPAANADFHYYSPDQAGNLFSASLCGLFRKEKDKSALTAVFADIPEFTELQQFAYLDQHNQLYAYSAFYGLNVLRKATDSYEKVYSFPETFIPRHAYEQNDSILWLGTTAGLIQFNTKALKIVRWYRTGDGLPNNTVYAIAPDGQERLWLSTNRGLCSFDLTTQHIIQFTDYPGQQGREYNRHAVCVARDGRILFGGVNGITAVHPTYFNRKMERPVIQFTSINDDQDINPFGHDQVAKAKLLKAGTSLMEFQFLAIDYNNSKLCRLKYKLDGVDEDWKETENPSIARYLNLKPGHYAFWVMASDANGEWSAEGKAFYFEIAAFWWQTLLFKLAVITAMVALMALVIRLWLAHKWNEQRSQLEKQLAILQEHERISADLHDDIGSTLSSISVYSELADKYYSSRPEKSHEIVHKISVQTRELMTRIEDIIWSLKPNSLDKTTFKSRLQEYGLELLTGKDMRYTVEVDQGVDDLVKDPFLRKNILLIIKEAINNSAKYSQASLVVIDVQTDAAFLKIRIEDNGAGFDKETAGNGNGLGNMKKRCEDIGGAFSLHSSPGHGTRIEVSVPMANIRH
jgi:signal transduction histidine kinase